MMVGLETMTVTTADNKGDIEGIWNAHAGDPTSPPLARLRCPQAAEINYV
jgi:hypothetical protein